MAKKANKWNQAYWEDLAERVGSTAVGGAIAVFSADGADITSITSEKAWLVLVGVPAVISLLKGLLVNLGQSGDASASLVGATSTQTGEKGE